MNVPKKEVAPAEEKLRQGDHEAQSGLTRPESYESPHGEERVYQGDETPATDIAPAHDCAIHFLLQRDPAGPWQLCYIPPTEGGTPQDWRTFGPEDLEEVCAYLKRVNAKNNVHFTVNPPRRVTFSKPTEADIVVHRAHVDVDLPNPPSSATTPELVAAFLYDQLRKIRERFEALQPKPTVLVFTGGGYQAFWDFAEPVTDRAQVKSINEQIARRFNEGEVRGDRCHSVDHLMRLPGTINRPKPDKVKKGRRPALARVIWDTGTRYRPEDFFDAGFTRPDPEAPKAGDKPAAKLERGEVVRLATLDDLPASVGEKCRRVIELGRDADPEQYPSDSEPVYFVMMELSRCGVAPGLIVGIVTDPKWGVSAHVLKKRSEAKAIKYAWDQLERGAAKEKAKPPLLFPGTPLRSAHDFVRLEMPNLRRFRADWFDYNGSCYVELEDETVRTALYNFLDRARTLDGDKDKPFNPSQDKVSSVADALRAVAHVAGENYLDVARWLRNPGPPPSEVVACANGILHLPTRTLLPATADFFTLNALEVCYDPNAPEPAEWLRFLGSLWEDRQSIELLQEWFGYVVMRDTDQQKILLILGPPRSGKTTIARVLTSLVGNRNVAAPTIHSLANDFGTHQLLGKQLAIMSEARIDASKTDSGRIASLLLSISGEDEVPVNRKNRDMLKVRLPVRFTIMSNELPALAESSGALSNRLLLLEMTRSFLGNEDRGLVSRLMRELPGILNWSFAGYERLKARGHFAQPESARSLREQFEDISSPVAAFARDRCVFDPDCEISKDDLFQGYRLHATKTGVAFPMSRQQFLSKFGAAFRGRVRGYRPRGTDKQRPRILEGVRLRTAQEQEAYNNEGQDDSDQRTKHRDLPF